ncbi:hypothetical protein B5M42_000115 [Paenibacillus athensensis]|uniref:Uncharacterized protein n=1 Tax=Paenibacillus athensensis TaxID=1967502 RepID=A0A4Y8PS61_9BACL|nr:hypothetical protein [Paenibacillus athensensis]MCD1257238.1 hypothetical protein [Paenibacillus athensensis]
MTTAHAYALPLAPYFNGKAVSWPDLGIWGCMEHSFSSLPGPLLPNGERIECEGIPFQFPATDTTDDDHISCEGQILELRCDRPFRQLALIGVTTWGDYEDTVRFTYERDGQTFSSRARLGLSDLCKLWDYKELSYGERVALRMPYYWRDRKPLEFPVGLWLQTLDLDPAALLQTVELPDNPYMYIFAITLL